MNELEMMIQQSEDNVGEAMLSCLDKADMMLEYVGYGNDALDEYVSEMFELFMEATARRKKADEIDAYMKKHNWGDVNAKTPAQAKKARALRNFLIMQDFDPSDGTIKSTDGKRRIKFNVNGERSRYVLNDNGQRIELDEDRRKRLGQVDKHFITNHEKGHEQFHNHGIEVYDKDSKKHQFVSYSDDWTYHEDENERGIKHIKDAKAKGKQINSHDDGSYRTAWDVENSPEELEADLHAAKTTRVRTKYAGRKRAVKRSGATRHLTDKEIENVYKNLQKFMNKPDDDRKQKIEKAKQLLDWIAKINELYPKIYNDLKQFPSKMNSKEYLNNLYKCCESLYDLTRKFDMNSFQSMTDGSSYYHDLMCVKQFAQAIERTKVTGTQNVDKKLQKLEYELKRYQKQLNDLVEKYKNSKINIETSAGRVIAQLKSTSFDLKEFIRGKIKETTENFREGGERQFFDKITSEFSDDRDMIINTLNETVERLSKISDVKLQEKKLKKKWKEWELTNYETDDSTQMRHDFVKKYVHECFEEFMMDYYSFENVFGDYMEE